MMKLADWGGGGSRERKRRTEADGGAQTYPAAPAYPAAGTAQTKPRYDNHDVLHGTEQTAGAATGTYLKQRDAPKTDAWGSAQRSGGFGLTVTDVDAPGGARKLTKRSTWQRDGSGIKSGWDYIADTTRAQTDAFADSRVGKTISGAMDSANAGYVNAAGTLNDYFNRYYAAPTVFDDRGNVDWEASVRAHRPSKTVQAAADRLHDRADALQMRGAQRLTEAKDGLGRVGQTLVDAGAAGTQMLGDAALNMIVPGGGLLAMGARAFGNAAAEARKAGADVARQAGYGAAVAGVELLSEKLFDGLAGIYGAGAADDFVERVISKMTKSAGGQRVLRIFASGLGEAGEEAVSGLIEPALNAIVDGQGVFSSTHYNADTRADIAHSAIVASILGGLGGAVDETIRGVNGEVDSHSIALTAEDKNGKILNDNPYEPDILIPFGIGAKAKDILVRLPDGTEVPLTPGTRISNVELIAGKGRNRAIDEIDGLLKRYPGTRENEWQKKKGIGYVDFEGESYKANIHYYEEPTVGRVRYKLKPDKAGNWFYED